MNFTKPLETMPFEVLASLVMGEWRMSSVATNHHQGHMIPWLRPCVGQHVDSASCGAAYAAEAAQRHRVHVSKHHGHWTLFTQASKYKVYIEKHWVPALRPRDSKPVESAIRKGGLMLLIRLTGQLHLLTVMFRKKTVVIIVIVIAISLKHLL